MAETNEHQINIELTKVDPVARYSVPDSDGTSNGVRWNNADDVILGAAAPIKPVYNDPMPAIWHTEGQSVAGVIQQQPAATSSKHPTKKNKGHTRRLAVDGPFEMVCPDCGKVITTKVEYLAGTCTFLACVGLAIFGCIFGCCLLPFLTNFTKDGIHTCPNCHCTVGIYKKL